MHQKTPSSNWIDRSRAFLGFMALVTFVSPLQSKDMGSMGTTFEIAEESVLEMIQRGLKAMDKRGTVAKHQLAIRQKVSHRALNPRPVTGLKKALQSRTFIYDPSITLTQNLKDEKGRVLVNKGERFNPLDTVSFPKPLVFFDGEDLSQTAWVLKHHQASKLILVRGSPQGLEELGKVPVYFDQGGVLTSKLKIKAVPAVVRQKGKTLEIQEVGRGGRS